MGDHQAKISKWTSSGDLSEEAGRNLSAWLTNLEFAAFHKGIASLVETEDLDELEDAFRVHITFGTGGIRGKMGPGPNRINLRTIGEAAQALFQYILKQGGPGAAGRGIAIAYDTRNNSDVFAREVAAIAAANGVTTHIFEKPRATPELSFAVRELGAAAGVVISASHNPPCDNGFKAYWADGGQVVAPHDQAIIAEVNALSEIKTEDYSAAVARGLIRTIPNSMDAAYLNKTSIRLSDNRDVSIVFSPLHGVGATSIVPALSALGFDRVTIVDEQNDFNGNFPTMPGGVANPEDPKTLTLAIELALHTDADIVMASDPDADRLGCALPLPVRGWNADPSDLALNGNQIGVLLCHHLLNCLKHAGKLPVGGGVFVKTIVTTDLSSAIAASFGLTIVDNLLVGFKYISEVIGGLDDPNTFLFGTEESHGYLATSAVRDKDAASAAMILADCAATKKAKGSSIRAYLDEIYTEFGYYCEIQKSVTREGAGGSRDIQEIMASLRETPPTEIAGRPVTRVVDRQEGTSTDPTTGRAEAVEGEKGNVLVFTLTEAGHTRVTARPSGTEPKIKYYVSVTSQDLTDLASDDLEQTKALVDEAARDILNAMVRIAEAALSD